MRLVAHMIGAAMRDMLLNFGKFRESSYKEVLHSQLSYAGYRCLILEVSLCR